MQLTKGGRGCGKTHYRNLVIGINAMHACIENALGAHPQAKELAQRHLTAIHKIGYDEMQKMVGNDPRADFLLNGLKADDRVEAIL